MSKKKKNIDLSVWEDRAALCPHFELCGGCTYQKISYETQLERKAAEVKELLGIEEPVFEGILPSPRETGYRNKMEFTFGDECKGGDFSLGLHMRGSFMNIVNLTDCKLVHDDLNQIRNAVRNFMNAYYQKGQITFHNNKTHQGYLRHLLLRRAEKTGEILAALVTSSQYPGNVINTEQSGQPDELLNDTEQSGQPDQLQISEEALMDQFTKLLMNLSLDGKIAGILHITNDALSDTVRSDKTDILYGRDYIYDEVLGLSFKISVFSFFQTNTRGAEVLYSKARNYASCAHGMLFDLYSGTGTIAQLMSSAVDQVIGVEIVEEAVEAARENAALNQIQNAQFIAEDVLKALDRLPVPDSLILDPPREGIHPKALGKILSYGVEQIVYISCKPSSLARDLQAFRLAGYEIVKACCVDMFPHTVHVETVCLLSNRKPDSYVHLNLKMKDYYRIKDAQKEQDKK